MKRDPAPAPTMPQTHGVVENPWAALRAFTDARIGLGRAGVSLPTDKLLAFQLAHARAQDAVHCPLDIDALREALTQALDLDAAPIALKSRAEERAIYLQRPDYGRRLNEASREALEKCAESVEPKRLAIVIVDGLSALAVQRNSAPFLQAFIRALAQDTDDWRLAPITIVEQGRV
ncbi:ethanolamine ammonia-lyase light chain EutC, partial [Halomonas sp. 707D4]